MKIQKAISISAGRTGEGIRSDCFVQFTVTKKDGIKIELHSKVASLYGHSIRTLVADVVHSYGIINAIVKIDDRGAVPFVLAARVETAVKRAFPEQEKAYYTDNKITARVNIIDRLRRTRLYLPGNEPHYFLNAALHKPDAVILDLEDSVAPSEKDAARILVRNALRTVDFGTSERMVRINPFPLGKKDLQEIVSTNVETILIPKCESALHIQSVEDEIEKCLKRHNRQHQIFLLPIIESALGVERAFEIATASKNICALAIGLEDYTADIGVERTKKGNESLFARSAIINAAKAAGVQALDSVFSDVNDEEGLRQSVSEAKAIGFEGKGCIHPRQIKIIHNAFLPSPAEIDYARRIIEAYYTAKASGNGVVALGSKMIDPPVVKRAEKILMLANTNTR
ncbi:MAG: citrate lyase subunit gamma [Bacteroidetes bacterium]|nr:citrate lyase subunit gamma [Bacteroidota bacterium]